VNTESLELILNADRFVRLVRVALGCAILGLAAWGHHVGLL
jgi:hypothetical protein